MYKMKAMCKFKVCTHGWEYENISPTYSIQWKCILCTLGGVHGPGTCNIRLRCWLLLIHNPLDYYS